MPPAGQPGHTADEKDQIEAYDATVWDWIWEGNKALGETEVTGTYDTVLVPEVLEHVPDVQGFLRQLDAVGASQYIITVPDAFSCFRRHFDYSSGAQTFVEVVHPDHNCWYTPYTLANVIAKYTPWRLDGMFFFNGMSLLAVASRVEAA